MPATIKTQGTGGPVTEAPAVGSDRPTVATPSPDYEWMARHWALPLLLEKETAEIRAQCWSNQQTTDAFVPKLPKEHEDDYKNRIYNLTAVPPFWEEALTDVVGTILAEDVRPVREGEAEEIVPEVLQEWWDAGVDRDDNDGNVFLNRLAQSSAGLGLSYVFVDHDAEQPFWVWHQAPQVLEVAYSHAGGRAQIERAKIRVRTRKANPTSGAWAWDAVDEIRVYYRGNPAIAKADVTRPAEGDLKQSTGRNLERYVLVEHYANQGKGDAEEWPETPDKRYYMLPPNGLDPETDDLFCEVPLYPFYSRYIAPFRAKPPLLKMAEMIRLWCIKDSDKNAIEQIANVPRDVLTGLTWGEFLKANDGNPVLGRGGVICLGHHQNAKLDSYEHAGSAIGALRQSVVDLKDAIAEAAYKTLAQRASGVELATLALLSEQKKNTRLHVMRTFWRQAFFAAMRRTAAYFNVPPARVGRWAWPDMSVSRLMSRGDSASFVERLVAVGGMDGQTAVEIGIELGLIPDSVKPDQVLARLREQGGGL